MRFQGGRSWGIWDIIVNIIFGEDYEKKTKTTALYTSSIFQLVIENSHS